MVKLMEQIYIHIYIYIYMSIWITTSQLRSLLVVGWAVVSVSLKDETQGPLWSLGSPTNGTNDGERWLCWRSPGQDAERVGNQVARRLGEWMAEWSGDRMAR